MRSMNQERQRELSDKLRRMEGIRAQINKGLFQDPACRELVCDCLDQEERLVRDQLKAESEHGR